MDLLHPTTLFITMAVISAAVTASMFVAYFAIHRAGYYLRWSYYMLLNFLGMVAVVTLQPVLGPTMGSIISNVIFLASMLQLIDGLSLFIGRRRKIKAILAIYSVFFIVILLPGYMLKDAVYYRIFGISVAIAAANAISAVMLLKSGALKDNTAGSTVIITFILMVTAWLIRGWQGLVSGTDNLAAPNLANMVILVLMILYIVQCYTLTIMSQSRLWKRLLETETALDIASSHAGTSMLFSRLAQELGTPAGNARMALSHYSAETERATQEKLASSALDNVNIIVDRLDSFRRIISSPAGTEKDIVRIGEIITAVIQLAARSEHLAGIHFDYADSRIRSTAESEPIRTNPAILFQGILSILEVAGRRAWIDSTGTVNLSTTIGKGIIDIVLEGIEIPRPATLGNRDEIEPLDFEKGHDMSFFQRTCRSMEKELSAQIFTAQKPNGLKSEFVIRLPRE